MNKKAQELRLNVVIIAALILIIIAVVVIVLDQQTNLFKSFDSDNHVCLEWKECNHIVSCSYDDCENHNWKCHGVWVKDSNPNSINPSDRCTNFRDKTPCEKCSDENDCNKETENGLCVCDEYKNKIIKRGILLCGSDYNKFHNVKTIKYKIINKGKNWRYYEDICDDFLYDMSKRFYRNNENIIDIHVGNVYLEDDELHCTDLTYMIVTPFGEKWTEPRDSIIITNLEEYENKEWLAFKEDKIELRCYDENFNLKEVVEDCDELRLRNSNHRYNVEIDIEVESRNEICIKSHLPICKEVCE